MLLPKYLQIAYWIPELVILEGMFMLNTTPLGSHRTFADYGQFLISRFIKPHFNSGSNEIHVLFDNPGRLPDNPKHFERKRRDNSAIVKTGHECKTVTSQLLIPRKWREDLVNCRNCKRSLVLFLSRYLLQSIANYMPRDTKLYVAGGFEGEIEDSAWFVTTEGNPQPNPIYTCNAEETDTLIWAHVNQSTSSKILILSPDTGVYHIGLPLIYENKI